MAVGAFLKRLLGQSALPAQLSYEDARAVLEARHHESERELAQRSDAKPEMLYYLAEHGNGDTRHAVAANPATPPAANQILAGDVDPEVRAELARKIGRLLPDLLASELDHVCEQTLDCLRRLADDQLPRVRAILAQEIKSMACVPADVVKKLACDIEDAVSVPILEYSPLLSDGDLLEVISSARAQAALAAVARRRGVSEAVSEAIVASLDGPAVAALLANPSARIREQTLEKIVDHAQHMEPWHGPLVLRSDLSLRALKRIAGFVGAALLEHLASRNDLDDDAQQILGRRLRENLEQTKEARSAEDQAYDEAAGAFTRGELDDHFVDQAVDRGNKYLIIESLTLLSKAPHALIEKIFLSRNAKAVTALCWHSGLAMRTAFKIQRVILKLQADELLPARAGVGFPLSEEEMRWHLSYFGFPETGNLK